MTRLTRLAHQYITQVLKPGDTAIDLTAGNGHDTLFLARSVVPAGRVIAFDIQGVAIETTRELLRSHDLEEVVELHCQSHADWLTCIPGEACIEFGAVMMNLGYLPRGDSKIVTQPQSTLAAIQQAIERLKPQGILSVVAYTGHCGGREEAECVREAFSRLPHDRFTIEQIPSSSDINAPILYVARRYGVATSSQSPSLAPARDKTS